MIIMENKEYNFVKDLVSVITPIYNSQKYLEETLDSVLNQSYKKIEIIIVDDCSTDHSDMIVNRIKIDFPEIRYHRLKKNKGAGIARNKCLEIARGQYVAFLDSDDVWYPDKIEKQIELMRINNIPFSYTAIEMIDDCGKKIKSARKINTKCDYDFLLKNTIIATSSVVIDRNLIGDFRMSSRRGGQDYATWLTILRKGYIANGINEPLVKYRVLKNSLSSNKLDSIKQVWEIQTKLENINKMKVIYNIIMFTFNAFKKYFL